MSKRVNNVVRIPASINRDFFRIWMEFLTPIHNLTDTEKNVVAAFLQERFELQQSISNEDVLDKVLMSPDVKAKVRDRCGISYAFFQVILGRLKKTHIIENGKLNSRFIPRRMKKGDNSFQLLLYFDLDEKTDS